MKTPSFLFRLLRSYVRGAMYLFCADIKVRVKELLSINGPLLITANHPNSFFDALVLVTHFSSPMYFLARGDVFKNENIAKILRWLHIIPIHRISEGPENLPLNEQTFELCQQIFRQNGIVLIFIEGLSLNNYELRPFKKGAARLAISSWLSKENENNLRILPVGLSYNQFKGFGKKIFVEMNVEITKENFAEIDDTGRSIIDLNETVREKLEELIIHRKINNTAQQQMRNAFAKAKSFKDLKENVEQQNIPHTISLIKILLVIPALAGMLLHAPLYLPLSFFIAKKTKGTVFYDSVLFGSLLITYPLYLLLIFVILSISIGLLETTIVIVSMPLFARATTKCFGL